MTKVSISRVVSSVLLPAGLVFFYSWSSLRLHYGTGLLQSLFYALVGGLVGFAVSELFARGNPKASSKGGNGSRKWAATAIRYTIYVMAAAMFAPVIFNLTLDPTIAELASLVVVICLIVLAVLLVIGSRIQERPARSLKIITEPESAIGDKKADTKVSRSADGSRGFSRWIDWAIHLTAYTMIAAGFFPGILGLDLAPATAVLVGGLVILALLTAIKGSVSGRGRRD